MADSRWYLVCYDVHDPKRLRKAAKKCEGYGERLQHSVFRLWLTRTEMEQMRWELTEILEPEDDVLVIPLCSTCVAGVKTTHSCPQPTDWPAEPTGHEII